jgi:uncharacterized protein (TIGR03032 family)
MTVIDDLVETNAGQTESTPMQQLDFKISCSRHFAAWLQQEQVSLAFSTYQTGELFLVGRSPAGELAIFERRFNRCMGLWTDCQTLWLASQFQLWRMENAIPDGQLQDGYDRVFVPRIGYTTGDVDIHDIAVESDGRVVFVSTLASCLATVSERYNFEPLWRPSFVSRIRLEDCCHLNGLALVEGRARYVTACGQCDIVDGWRDCRQDGGCVIDITSDALVCDRLSMPHSPRMYRGKLWLLDSGSGYLGYVDLANGNFERVAFCAGFARGLSLVGNYAVVGLSMPRREGSFTGLALDDNLEQRNAKARCGLQVIDLDSGDVVHWLRIDGSIQELYDVAVLPGVRQPKALGFLTNEIQRHVSLPSGEPKPGQRLAPDSGSVAADRFDAPQQ